MSEDEVVIADFGGGCQIVGRRLEGETDDDVRRRFPKYKRELHARMKKEAEERKRWMHLLSRWTPPKDMEFKT